MLSTLLLSLLLGVTPPPLLEDGPVEDPAAERDRADEPGQGSSDRPREDQAPLPVADPISDFFQADLQTMALHGVLNCGVAVVTFPLSCLPCAGFFCYPLAVGIGTDLIGQALNKTTGWNFLVPTIAFGVVHMAMFVLSVGIYVAFGAFAAAIANSTPGLTSFLSVGSGISPLTIVAYGAGLGMVATTIILAVLAATGSWYFAGRDEQRRGGVKSLLPFLLDQEKLDQKNRVQEKADDDGAGQRPPRDDAWQKESRSRVRRRPASKGDDASRARHHLMAHHLMTF